MKERYLARERIHVHLALAANRNAVAPRVGFFIGNKVGDFVVISVYNSFKSEGLGIYDTKRTWLRKV